MVWFHFQVKQKTNKLNLIIPDRKLKFNMKKDVYKNRITLNLDKVHTQKIIQYNAK